MADLFLKDGETGRDRDLIRQLPPQMLAVARVGQSQEPGVAFKWQEARALTGHQPPPSQEYWQEAESQVGVGRAASQGVVEPTVPQRPPRSSCQPEAQHSPSLLCAQERGRTARDTPCHILVLPQVSWLKEPYGGVTETHPHPDPVMFPGTVLVALCCSRPVQYHMD